MASLHREPPRAVKAGGRAAGEVAPPPSKSVTHRYLTLALLAGRPVVVERPLVAEDTELYAAALRRIGFSVAQHRELWQVAPLAQLAAGADLHCGNAGTLLRLLTAALAAVPGRWRLDGTPRLRERPVGPLVEALRGLGAEVVWEDREGYPPLLIDGGTLAGGEVTLDAGMSSQYLSALLLAGLRAASPVTVRVSALASAPYVDVTLAAAARWGGRVRRLAADRFQVEPGFPSPLPERVTVEGDFSAACYPAAAAVLTGGEVRLRGLDPTSAQGDRGFLELLDRMGAEVRWRGGVLSVGLRRPLAAIDADLGAMPDQVPTLAALAPFAAGTTRITGVAHLRVKESDRLAAMARELGRLGVPVEERDDGLTVGGCWAGGKAPSAPVVVDSHGDHRIAMALALIGLARPGVAVTDPGVVAKSYPGFWRDLESLGVG